MLFAFAKGRALPKTKTAGLKILAATIIASQVGCGDIQKEAAKNEIPPITETVNKVQTSGDAKFSLQELDIPHQYQILVSWPAEVTNVVIEDSGKRIFESDSVRQYTHPIKDNSKFNFRVFAYDSDKPVLIGEFSGLTPRDYSIEASTELKQDLNIEAARVFLANQAKIQTNGFKLAIKADKIYSDNVEIYSFLPGAKAPFEADGASGGSVEIRAKVAVGHLRVNLRGQNGGDGFDGKPWDIRAASGGRGRNGAHECARASVGGIGIGGPLKCWCTRNPDNGGTGANGAKGRDGTRAGRGGNSGSLLVEVQEKTEFVVEPFQTVGLAGIPGKGGAGQLGGIGGPGGDSTSSECSGSSSGAEGKQGDKGIDGAKALDGNVDPLCISIGQGEGKCLAK